MAGIKKWKVPTEIQRVKWSARNTRRGVKNKQIVVFTQEARSAPTTPSRRATSTEPQQFMDGDPSEPLTIPTSQVYLSMSLLLLNDIVIFPRLKTII
jgi:hypothetical protein